MLVRRLIPLVVAAFALAAVASTASASPRLLKGLYDEANTLYGNPDRTFAILGNLRSEAVRMNLYWGGRFGVADRRPTDPTDPEDPAYDWSLYDRAVLYAAQYRLRVVFSIYGTPRWASGRSTLNRPPRRFADLQQFAYAAATRYSGTYERPEDGRVLPPVRHWLAWNEPNNPVFLQPQYSGGRIASAVNYAKICNAVYNGVHQTLIRSELVACGVTAPRGNNIPHSRRPSVSPIAFLRAMKRAGARRMDAYAHHPYYGRPTETPSTPPPARTAVTLGNINVLIAEVTRLYGPKRIWLTEYGYQTRPQDRFFGVTYAQQARYLTQAFAIARRHPRIDMLLWFLLRDEPASGIWQSGLMTVTGARKPSYRAFQLVPR